MSRVIVSLSGGMDSATVLAHCREHFERVIAVGFTYGSKHNGFEQPCAEALAAHYGVPYRLLDLSPIMAGFQSDLLKSGGAVPEGHYSDASMSRTVVPARNIIFMSIVAGIAWSEGAEAVAIGIHQGDHAIYADCRTEFFKAMDLALYLGTDHRVQIIAPFLRTDKTGILNWGLAHDVPYHLTRTCYKEQPVACGKCGSCVERLEAFAANGQRDPIAYEGSI